MELQVYQINMVRDTQRIKFQPLDTVLKQTEEIDASLYDKVFDGELECADLEEAFEILNMDAPPGYTGHSLSVSDVVKTADGYFYCDSFGFEPVKFDESETAVMEPVMRF